ncbi:hypothetical protein CLUG_00770 [Clavispora lusitaniae ATCC 42720]|uniref:Uncharacterized protein n=2 Tax=Clavispora lusitaniae TaxID=36911 RepID=C4XXU8_CLAL4|nr:uncharacterized protein CLUG_00770 [Clavispora lusitaniae ATCC 42720]EEQ36647.1 hypothetical protein CLUG_00770 [Clavispora lusitaniae ATCC 42720]KAF5212889.1 hypothetical protein E0198_000401 [Clavispora lusitaniae]
MSTHLSPRPVPAPKHHHKPLPKPMEVHDKRHARGRFSWVKRLVQGQTRTGPDLRTRPYQQQTQFPTTKYLPENASGRKSQRSTDVSSDSESYVSDNISTVPLKSVVSHGSTTNSPSILSTENQADNSSYMASTAETSLAPSTHISLSPSIHTTQPRAERDSESIVTLASSSRRGRRRSIDTNCSMAGIAPASIVERLTVHPVSQDD